ncbi:MAG: class I SAM-dependent methyltransferase [Oscillospiraceae bacterium]|jgi:23S rRNA (cytosine1962-C5)-methyltransferase|nr:class I SAM-dependent methyltransferase [Oscillospiraceae bacterium]MDD3261739.1 class I SAM-dependent methyltransferase [Oscillospiraceae bacterium]
MRTAEWQDYELLDTSRGERLERWGSVLLIRPDPQIIWDTPRKDPRWKQADARYIRSSSGGGHWQMLKQVPPEWEIHWSGMTFRLKTMGFKHTGLFPEQAVNWNYAMQQIQHAGRPIQVLNLFGYTGAATLACLKAGASVCHVDASKGMVQWAKENAQASSLADRPVRWLVDDCTKFVQREHRRGHHYDAIIMDPPSYGRGPGGEVWKLEEQLYSLISMCIPILSEKPLFFLLNSYTTGLSPAVMQYLLGVMLQPRFGGSVQADEIGLRVSDTGFTLPCGSTAIAQF